MHTTSSFTDGEITVEVRRERIPIDSWSPVPDPNWVKVDTHGHEHRYNERSYPTLRWVVDEEDYVVYEDGYPEEYPGSGHYECIQCGETITPGTHIPTTTQYIEGATEFFINGEPATQDEAGRILAEFASRSGE